jgi:acetyl esterase/lipase
MLALGLFIGECRPTAIDDPRIVRLLWPEGAPGALGTDKDDRPALELYLPPAGTANGTAVVICPGGSYDHLVVGREGREPARWLNARGVAAFVLYYRLAPRYRHPAPLLDAQRAIRMVRARASTWGVAPDRIGIWGFSAGGHLASTAATRFDDGDPAAVDVVERVSSRPDFAILCYPIVTFDVPYTHFGSRANLVGPNPGQQIVDSLSSERHVTSCTPPTFLFHTGTDTVAFAENSVLFYAALQRAGVPAELHMYERGEHGVGLATRDRVLSEWTNCLEDWLRQQNLLPATR